MSAKQSTATQSNAEIKQSKRIRTIKTQSREGFKSATKTLQTTFKQDGGVDIHKIECLKWFGSHSDDFVLIPNKMNICAYIESPTSLVYIVQLGAKDSLNTPEYYKQLIGQSKSMTSDFTWPNDNSRLRTYWIIYKNKKNYSCFVYSLDSDSDEPDYINNFKLEDLSRLTDSKRSLSLDSKTASIIQSLYEQMNIGSDLRTAFFIIAWYLLSHADNPKFVMKSLDGIDYTISDILDLINRFDKNEDEPLTPEEMEIVESLTVQDIQGVFEQIIDYKVKLHGHQSLSDGNFDELSDLMNKLFKSDVFKIALSIIDDIYYKLYIPHHESIDINRLAFEIENTWNNRTSEAVVAKKGQIYTHKATKDLVIRLIENNITNDSTCYDPTCGTGGFVESFYKYCEKKGFNNVIGYGNEIDEDLRRINWLNSLQSDLDIRMYNRNCFHPSLKDSDVIGENNVQFLLMNPPYGMKGSLIGAANRMTNGFEWKGESANRVKNAKNNEWTFCRYNLETFVKPGGWFSFLIPTSCVSENKQNTYDKEQLIKEAEIWFIIRINEKIFDPQAGKASVLVVGRYIPNRTKEEIETWKTKCVDFRDDGGKPVIKKGRLEFNEQDLMKLQDERIFDYKDLGGIHRPKDGSNKRSNVDFEVLRSIKGLENVKSITDIEGIEMTPSHAGAPYYEERVLTANDNWLYAKLTDLSFKERKLRKLEYLEQRHHALMMTAIHQMEFEEEKENEWCEWRDVRISDLFEFMGRGKLKANGNKPGPYPLVSASGENNGITDYIDKYTFDDTNDENKPCFYTIAGNGVKAGVCFLQNGKFNAVSDVQVMKLKDEYGFIPKEDRETLAYLIGEQLQARFNWNDKLNNGRLEKAIVSLPYNTKTNKIDLSATVQNNDSDSLSLINRSVPVAELFELVKCGNRTQADVSADGKYPLIGRSEVLNGIVGYTNKYDLDGTFISVAGDSAAPCFVQHGKFAVGVKMYILKLKSEYEYLEEALTALAFNMTLSFKYKYSWNTGINQQHLMNESIPNIPYVRDPRTNEWKIDVGALRYMYM